MSEAKSDEFFVDVKPVNSRESRSADDQPMYKKRVKIHPKRVHGTFRQFKWYIMIATLAVYYIAPWLRWDRGPDAPSQAILIDFPGRRFFFFFIEIWPHELYYVAGLLIMAGIGLFLTASVVGRAWCGYACPQTVWVDLFLAVERWVEGDRNKRIRLDRAPWSFDKIRKRVTKHLIWLVIAVLTGGAWVFYFADAPTLLVNLVTLQAPPVAYLTIAILAFTTYTLGGFMREQVCTYMCPWPRIQGAMVDEDTLIINYRDWRGEPRGSLRTKRNPAEEPLGDCVACNQCVVVCPMGIDIRDGQQLECITCGLCIDACNTVMERIGRPGNLIAYDTHRRNQLRAEGETVQETHWIRPRTVIYFALWCLIGVGMLFALATRSTFEANVLHDRNPLFVQLTDGGIRNGYTLKVRNMLPRERNMILSASALKNAKLFLPGQQHPDIFVPVSIAPDSVLSLRLFVVSDDQDMRRASTPFSFRLLDENDGKIYELEAVFRGPGK